MRAMRGLLVISLIAVTGTVAGIWCPTDLSPKVKTLEDALKQSNAERDKAAQSAKQQIESVKAEKERVQSYHEGLIRELNAKWDKATEADKGEIKRVIAEKDKLEGNLQNEIRKLQTERDKAYEESKEEIARVKFEKGKVQGYLQNEISKLKIERDKALEATKEELRRVKAEHYKMQGSQGNGTSEGITCSELKGKYTHSRVDGAEVRLKRELFLLRRRRVIWETCLSEKAKCMESWRSSSENVNRLRKRMNDVTTEKEKQSRDCVLGSESIANLYSIAFTLVISITTLPSIVTILLYKNRSSIHGLVKKMKWVETGTTQLKFGSQKPHKKTLF